MKTLLQQYDETEELIVNVKTMLKQPGLNKNGRKSLHVLLNDQLDRLERLWSQFGFKK